MQVCISFREALILHDICTGAQNRRPLVAGECQSLAEAEKARRGIVRDVTKKIAMIQNGTVAHIDHFHSLLPQRVWASIVFVSSMMRLIS